MYRKSATAKDRAPANEDVRWDAVLRRDQNRDGEFVYAVKTTGIFCHPSCAARKPNRANVDFFDTAQSAIAAGFRPCKRCRPQKSNSNEDLESVVVRACQMIESQTEIPTLHSLAQSVGLSPHHFHRLFKSALGVTPIEYARAKRAQRLKSSLAKEASITQSIYGAGFSSNGPFYAQSSKTLGMTPTSFRAGGKGESIRFALGHCSLGHLLIAATDVGVCSISLGNDATVLLNGFQDRFNQATLIGDDNSFAQYIATIVAFVESPTSPLSLPLDIRGTAFQRKVWNALLKTLPGETLSYSALAKQLGMPKSARAVANACGANGIAIAIPCHRVVRQDGQPYGYRWGIERKIELLQRETRLNIDYDDTSIRKAISGSVHPAGVNEP